MMKEEFGHKYEELLVEPGFKAPDFTLKDENGQDTSLYGFLDDHNTVLVFIRGIDDRFTHEQLDFLKDSYERIKAHCADVLVVSYGSMDFNRNLVWSRKLPFHILSDENCEVIKKYDIYNEFDKLIGPNLFILNCAGLISFMYNGKNPDDIVDEADVIRVLHAINDACGDVVFGGVAERHD